MFRGRAERKVAEAGYDPARLPPGQYLTEKWPVLHAGDVPDYPADLAGWDFRRLRRGRARRSRSRGTSSTRCPRSTVTQDIHCVTRWSRFDATFTRRPVVGARRARRPRQSAHYAIAHSEAGYTANVPALVPRGGGSDARDARRRRAAHARARLAAAARDRPGQVLLEEREVAARDRAPRHGRSRASGSATATTTTPIPGRSSATRSEEALERRRPDALGERACDREAGRLRDGRAAGEPCRGVGSMGNPSPRNTKYGRWGSGRLGDAGEGGRYESALGAFLAPSFEGPRCAPGRALRASP